MKVLGEKTEVRVETSYKLAGIKCDVCGKIIEPPSIEENLIHITRLKPDIMTGEMTVLKALRNVIFVSIVSESLSLTI